MAHLMTARDVTKSLPELVILAKKLSEITGWMDLRATIPMMYRDVILSFIGDPLPHRGYKSNMQANKASRR